ncbi:A24 family peptidase [Oxalicibacterium faecigallinarum]|nr:prepilin peptidase [Oxalicibacterium faecigallinarum]
MTVVLLLLCGTVFIYDLLLRRVPNWLLLTAFSIHAATICMTGEGFGGIDIWQSLSGGAIGFLLFIPLYALRAMGAGDVKFFALLGLMMGTHYLIPLWLIGSVLAGVHATAWYLSTTSFVMTSATWHRIQASIMNSEAYQRLLKRRAGRRGIPYAAYLAVAAIATGAS